MSNQGRHPILLIMYYLSAAQSQKSQPTIFVYLILFFFFLDYFVLGLAVGLCVVNVGFGFPSRAIANEMLRQLRHIYAGFFFIPRSPCNLLLQLIEW